MKRKVISDLASRITQHLLSRNWKEGNVLRRKKEKVLYLAAVNERWQTSVVRVNESCSCVWAGSLGNSIWVCSVLWVIGGIYVEPGSSTDWVGICDSRALFYREEIWSARGDLARSLTSYSKMWLFALPCICNVRNSPGQHTGGTTSPKREKKSLMGIAPVWSCSVAMPPPFRCSTTAGLLHKWHLCKLVWPLTT